MLTVEVICIITFFILLIFGIGLFNYFYICGTDCSICENFESANRTEKWGTKEYTLKVQKQFFSEGIWCVPYIAASISTPIALWFLSIPFTVKNFAYIFLVTFAVFYFMISFVIHHYAKPIIEYTINYLQKNNQL